MKLRAAWIAVVLLGVVLGGCASTSMVWREPGRGELALSRDTPRARRIAAEQMQSHCGEAGYRIVREENVVVGQRTQAMGQAQTWGSGGQVFAQGSTTQVQELHLTYACEGAS